MKKQWKMTEQTFCTTCGTLDSYRSNGDVSWCSECGDTENMKFEGDYTETEFDQLIEEYYEL